MKRIRLFLIAAVVFAFGMQQAFAGVDIVFEWQANPPEQQISEYRLYKVGDSFPPKSVPGDATTLTLQNVQPAAGDCWQLTAVNWTESEPSAPACLPPEAGIPLGLKAKFTFILEFN